MEHKQEYNRSQELAEKCRAEAEALVALLAGRGLTITTAESCTGGLIAAAITSVPGSSAVLHQGYVTYCDAAKRRLVGVPGRILKKYTAVSPQTAARMADGARKRARADIAVSVTGYAGPPSGDADEEVGLVYIGCSGPGMTRVRECRFPGGRADVRMSAVLCALRMAQKQASGIS